MLSLVLVAVGGVGRSGAERADQPPTTAAPTSTGPATRADPIEPDGYAFIEETLVGGPTRWNGCGAITYALELRQAPRYAEADVLTAFDSLGRATSLRFVRADVPRIGLGDTFERMADREHGMTDLGPDVVLVWVSHARYARMVDADRVRRPSIATTFWFTTSGARPELVGAVVILDAKTAGEGGFDGWWSHGATVLHELGHAVGLAHVDDPDQIMYGGRWPDLDTSGWGSGDLEGLRRLGRADDCA